MENHKQERERFAVLHRISANWEAKLSLTHIAYTRQGANVLPNDLNLVTQTFGLFAGGTISVTTTGS